MAITDCRYANAANSVVNCQIDGSPASVPVIAGNRQWDEIVALGLTIAAFVPAEDRSETGDFLSKEQLKSLLEQGITTELLERLIERLP